MTSSTPEANNYFGDNIQFSTDSSTIAVGEPLGDNIKDNNGFPGSDIGSVQLFTKTTGDRWIRLRTLYSSLPTPSGISYVKTFEFEFNSTGTMLAIGDSFSSINLGTRDNNGSVQLYSKTVDGWILKATLISNTPSLNKRFGIDFTFSPDGSTLAIMELPDVINGDTLDTVHLFNETVDGWAHLTNLRPRNLVTDYSIARGNWFNLAFSPDNSQLAFSTDINVDINGIRTRTGNVEIFRKTTNSWSNETTLASNSPATFNGFGYNFKFSPNNAILAILEPAGDINGSTVINDVGTVQLFFNTAKGWRYATTLVSNTPVTDNKFGNFLEFSPDSSTLVVSEIKVGVVNIFDLTTLVK